SREEILRRLTLEEPAAPRSWERSIPPDLETIVLKALAKEPGERYGTAEELAADLRAFLAAMAFRARRPSLTHRLRTWGWRQRVMLPTAAVVAFVCTVAAAIWIWEEKQRAEGARQLADERRQQAEATADLLESAFRNLDPWAEKKDEQDLKDRLIAKLDE